MLLTLLALPFTYSWVLLQWLCESTITMIVHTFYNIALFPKYIYDSLCEALTNWYNFFFLDIPHHIAALCTAVLWITESIDDTYHDAHEFFSSTIPCYWYDTFGDLIGDITYYDLTNICKFFFIVIAVTTIYYLEQYCNCADVTTPPSPTIAAEEGHNIPAMGVQYRVENTAASFSPAPAVNHVAAKPMVFEHFQPSTGYFNRTYPNGYKVTAQYLATGETSFPYDEDREKYGSLRVLGVPITDEDESGTHTVMEEPAEPQRLITTNNYPVSQPEAATPPHEAMEIVSSPPERVLDSLQPILPPRVQSIEAIQTSVSIPAATTPMLPSELLQAPANDIALLPPQSIETPQAPATHYIPSYEERLNSAFQTLHGMSDELRQAMLEFLGRIIASSQDYEESGSTISRFLTFADETLSVLFPEGMPTEKANLFDWAPMVLDFWGEVQPRGHLFLNHEDQNVAVLVTQVYQFGYCLSLQLQDPDMSLPTSHANMLLAIMEEPLPVTPTKDIQATPTPAPIAPDKTLNTSGLVFGIPVPVPQKPADSIFQQQAFTFKPTEVNQASSNPTPSAPLSAAKIFSPLTQPPVQKVSQQDPKESAFHDDAFWVGKYFAELTDLDRKTFGWSNDDARNKMIWTYSSREELKLSGSSAEWTDAAFVKKELLKRAPAFKRATFVLRMQKDAGDHRKHTSLAFLLGEVMQFIDRAGQMTRKCGGMPPENVWSDWCKACAFLHNDVYADDDVDAALRKEYGSEKWKDFERVWAANEELWMIEE